MGNVGNIEKLMVAGILVIILGILGVAIHGRNQVENPESSAVAQASGGGGGGQLPLKPRATPNGGNVAAGNTGRRGPGQRNGADNEGAMLIRSAQDVDQVDVDRPNRTYRNPPPAPPINPTPVPPPRPAVNDLVGEGARTYTVKSGDTLEGIAIEVLGDRKFVNALRQANEDVNPRKMWVGQVINLPTMGDDLVAVVPIATDANSGRPGTYTVVNGDTLIKIAKRFYGSSGKYKAIINANPDTLSDPNELRVGMVLKLP